MDISNLRHQSIFDASRTNPPITIIGAGATGSRVFEALVCLGLTNITVVDYDVVEPHNLANQLYEMADVGQPKVDALRRWYQAKTGAECIPGGMCFVRGYCGEDACLAEAGYSRTSVERLHGVMFLMTDTMASRKAIYEQLKLTRTHDRQPRPFLVIETRMASSYGNVFAFSPYRRDVAERWFETLGDDDDENMELSPCGTSISVGPTATIIANLAVWQMILSLTNPEAVSPSLNVFLKPTMLTESPL